MITKRYHVSGMHCASCKVNIENAFQKNEHVKDVSVNYGSQTMEVTYDDEQLSSDSIGDIVRSAGDYVAKDVEENTVQERKDADVKKMKKMRVNLIVAAISSIPFIIEMIIMIGDFFGLNGHEMIKKTFLHQMHIAEISIMSWMSIILSGFILFYGGRAFFKNAYKIAKKFSTNMDTLVVIGASSAWFYSTAVVLYINNRVSEPYPVFFEAAVFIILFILIGRYLEARSRMATQKSVESLYAIQSKTAVIIKDGEEHEIAIEDVKIGDKVVVRSGQKIPVDGMIIKGSTTIDESMISGESMPVEKVQGDKVIGGTLNRTGVIVFETKKVGSETVLSQIIKMVEEAQGTSVPIQKLADTVASFFVPIVILIAICTFLFWFFLAPHIGIIPAQEAFSFAVYVTISVLVIACPCALGLATPTAIVVAIGHAARRGILIKSAQIIENAHKIKHMIFDKTGTITQGKPSVVEAVCYGDEILCDSYAFAIESLSDHPVAHAITEHTKDKVKDRVEVSDFYNLEGEGVRAKIDEKKVFIIKSSEIQKFATASQEHRKKISTLKEKGYTVSCLIVENRIMAIYAIADPIKRTSAKAIEDIKNNNIEPIMVTGDHVKIAQSVAHEVGIDHVISNAVPADKERIVREVKEKAQSGDLVAVVGDGINDAPALARADIGIAMGAGSDIAIESGDIVIVKGSLQKIVESIELSHKTMRVIKQNLFWAFGYNVLAIPIAFGLLYPHFGIVLSPAIAAAAMALSSVSVVFNSLRLRGV